MRTTFDRFCLAGGCFGGGVAGALVLGGTVLLDLVRPGTLAWWPFALGIGVLSGFVGGVVGSRTTVTPETASRLRDRPGWIVALLTVSLALIGLTVWQWSATGDSLTGPVLGFGTATALALVGYFGLLHAAESLYLHRIDAETDLRVPLPPTVWGRRWGRVRKWVAPVAVGAVLLGLFEWATGGTPLFLLVIPAMFGLFNRPSEFTITDAGLRKDRSVHPWHRFGSFRFEASALVIESDGRGQSGFRFPREDIDDEAAVREALSRVLEEKSE